MSERVEIERARMEDAEEILRLQKLTYRSEAEIYDDPFIQPLTQSIEEVREEFGSHSFLKAEIEGRIVGSVRARDESGTCFVGKLIVHPDFQGRGIGTALMSEMEDFFHNASQFELFTGHKSERNLRLYEHLGYERFGEEQANDTLTMVFMRKPSAGRGNDTG